MADDEKAGDEQAPDEQPMNRAQRRAAARGRPDPHLSGFPQSGDRGGGTAGPGESFAGRPDQDQQHDTGAGTGGATESADRIVKREGIHLGNDPNS